MLKQGDTIGLITPAGPITEAQLETVLSNVKKLGLNAHYSSSVLDRVGYFAGSEAQRISELYQAFENPNVKAILCARGGYGTTTLLDKLDYARFARHPKQLIGMSDITALLHALHKYAQTPVYHGIVGISDLTPYTLECFGKIFFEQNSNLELKSFDFNSDDALYQPYVITHGKAEGALTGGNLSLLASLVGTPYDTDWTDKLVFLEDVNEAPYAIDRMLTQLWLGGKFKGVRGLILGVFAGCEARDENSFRLRETITRKLQPLDIPTVYGFSFGHISNQATFPIGAQAVFDTERFSLNILRR